MVSLAIVYDSEERSPRRPRRCLARDACPSEGPPQYELRSRGNPTLLQHHHVTVRPSSTDAR